MNFIHPAVSLCPDLQIGHFCVIEQGATIGQGVTIGNKVTIFAGSVIGDNVHIADGAVIGKQPKPSKTSTIKYDAALAPLTVGNNTTIGANAVLYAGSTIGENALIADLATVRENCRVGNYVVVGRGVAVENDTTIGDYTKIQTGAYITAHMDIEDHVFIAPMVTTTNDNFMGRTEERFKHIKGATIKRGARVGGGSILLPGVTVAEESFIAAGALVAKDTVERQVVMGLPARKLRAVPEPELLKNQAAKKTSGQDTVSEIPFIDLAAQQKRIKPALFKRIDTVLDHGQYIMGPEIFELEDRLAAYVGVKHCISVASGTDALLIALMALNIGLGNEVITTPFSFVATAEVIALLGAKPVFVDIDPRTYNLDPKLIEPAITAYTKAIMPVSLYGQCADYDAINAIAAKHGLAVIEDGAQSFGATYKGRRSCGLSTIGCTSFFPSKPLGCYGDGGACFTNDYALADKMKQIRVHGQDRRYHHPMVGLNGRLDTLQAAILLAKLEIFNEEVEARIRIGRRYTELLGGTVVTPYIETYNTSVYAQYTIEVDNRDEVQKRLKAAGIPTTVHYPIPLHLQPVFDYLDIPEGSFSRAEKAAKKVLSLPMSAWVTEENINWVKLHLKNIL